MLVEPLPYYYRANFGSVLFIKKDPSPSLLSLGIMHKILVGQGKMYHHCCLSKKLLLTVSCYCYFLIGHKAIFLLLVYQVSMLVEAYYKPISPSDIDWTSLFSSFSITNSGTSPLCSKCLLLTERKFYFSTA